MPILWHFLFFVDITQLRTHSMLQIRHLFIFALFLLTFAFVNYAQATKAAREHGSQIAKAGFKNEDEIRDKFNAWKTDADARAWLVAMDYKLGEIESILAAKPHGEKADVEVVVRTKSGERKEGISIKLVSSPNGFNQIDKRWLRTYAKMWSMPKAVEDALKLFVGEKPPNKTSRDSNRMYLNEFDVDTQRAVLDFFTANKDRIVSDLIEGDGTHSAGWIMVALKATANTRWTIKRSTAAAAFYAEGKVEITRAGNLKIGRITMQRKGGDGGRDTAKMLQFKINPVQLFDAK